MKNFIGFYTNCIHQLFRVDSSRRISRQHRGNGIRINSREACEN